MITVTGGISVGKSLIVNYISNEYNFNIISVDLIGHQVLLCEDIKREISFNISSKIFDINDNIDRQKLGKIVFSNKKKLETLNAIVGPSIFSKLNDAIEDLGGKSSNVILEHPKILEFDYYREFSPIIQVSSINQLQWLMERDGINESEALMKINSQSKLSELMNKPDFMISTGNSMSDNLEQVDVIMDSLMYKKIKS